MTGSVYRYSVILTKKLAVVVVAARLDWLDWLDWSLYDMYIYIYVVRVMIYASFNFRERGRGQRLVHTQVVNRPCEQKESNH